MPRGNPPVQTGPGDKSPAVLYCVSRLNNLSCRWLLVDCGVDGQTPVISPGTEHRERKYRYRPRLTGRPRARLAGSSAVSAGSYAGGSLVGLASAEGSFSTRPESDFVHRRDTVPSGPAPAPLVADCPQRRPKLSSESRGSYRRDTPGSLGRPPRCPGPARRPRLAGSLPQAHQPLSRLQVDLVSAKQNPLERSVEFH